MQECNHFDKNASLHSTDDVYGFGASTKIYKYGRRKVLCWRVDVLRSKFSNIIKENKIY